VVIGLLGRTLFKGKTEIVPAIIGCTSVFLSFVVSFLSVLALYRYVAPDADGSRVFTRELFTWIEMGAFRVPFKLHLDALSSVMILVVTGVGFLIHVYSYGYMHKDPSQYRFFAYMNLFTCAMLILVLGGNFLLMFIGWEGVGLCSYLLIGFWFEKDWHDRRQSCPSPTVWRLLGSFCMLLMSRSWSLDYQTIFAEAPHKLVAARTVTAITMLLFIGAIGNRRRYRCMCGCETRWKAQRRRARSFTPPRWSPPASHGFANNAVLDAPAA
jgi:NADH-quinone oxidoreductase subunit L